MSRRRNAKFTNDESEEQAVKISYVGVPLHANETPVGYCKSCLEPVFDYDEGYSSCCNKRIVDDEERAELKVRYSRPSKY